MSIKSQKILRFIPIVNILTMFAWIRVCSVKSIKPFDFLIELLKMFSLFFIITIIRIACSFIFKNEQLDHIVLYISIYFYFLSMAWISVRAQEKILLKSQEHENN